MDTKEKAETAKPERRPGTTNTRNPNKKTQTVAPQRKPATAQRTPSVTKRVTREKQQPVKGTPDVVYLAPKPFSRNRLILHLTTVIAVVVALILGLAVFFKVENIYVSGTEKYSAWEIQQAAGIQTGDNLLTFNRAKAAGKIISALPYVKSVRIGINLPDTVNIEIEEVEVTYVLQAEDESLWLVGSTGKVVDRLPESDDTGYTRFQGILLNEPQIGQQAVAAQNQQQQTDPDGNTVPVTVTAAERLQTALDVAGFLELNGIYGTMNNLDVTDISSIRILWKEGYEIFLGSNTDMNRKISAMKAAMEQYDGLDRGTLDVSDPNQIIFRNQDEE